MNFRVFLLIGAMGAFGALWSSDGRYQTQQIAMVRAERARSAKTNPVFIAKINAVFIAKIKAEVTDLRATFARKVAEVARTTTASQAPSQASPIPAASNDAIAPNALFGRLVVAWVLNVDLGNGVSVLTERATNAKAQFEERFCLLRFQARQATFFAARRAAAFLRAQIAASQQAGRFARIIIREVPIEESQAPAAGGRQTR